MTTRPLNDLDRMQIIAGDSSGLLAILPWFVSTAFPLTRADFDRQSNVVAGLPHLLPPPK